MILIISSLLFFIGAAINIALKRPVMVFLCVAGMTSNLTFLILYG